MTDEKIIIRGDGNTVGLNIKQIRESRSIKMDDMVARIAQYQILLRREALVKIEGGRQHIKVKELRAIRDILKVSYEDLLDAPGDELMAEIDRKKKEKEEKKFKRNKGSRKKLNVE